MSLGGGRCINGILLLTRGQLSGLQHVQFTSASFEGYKELKGENFYCIATMGLFSDIGH